jgi:serine/threonine-protein kinase
MAEIALLNNRYQLEKPLGSGGMAVVYRARDHMLERTVAVKVLREDYSRDVAFRERFRQEAQAAANLSHPNIVTVHDFGIDSGRLFIVMEFVPGTNLNSKLQTRGRFTITEALPILLQTCAGVGYAHRAGLVHCDIKPHNFLITPDNRVKVTDFGIARALASIHPGEKTDVVWGSPQYFSPEQAAGDPPSPASDVYSLGVVMYYMLTGRLPFTASTASELAHLHRSAPPLPPRHYNPTIPAPLEQIIMKVLAKEPSQRYRTADQLGRVLRNFGGIQVTTQADEVQEGDAQVVVAPPVRTTVRPANGIDPEATIAPQAALPTPARANQPLVISHPNSGTNFPPRPVSSPISQPVTVYEEDSGPAVVVPGPFDLDWSTLLLGLLAVLAIGGLIPLYVWVYYAYFPAFP